LKLILDRQQEKQKGEPILTGCSSEAVLEHAGIRTAKAVVITAGDPVSSWRIIETARRLNPGVHIIARTHFLNEIDGFYTIGANEVVSDEFECSIELFARVLNRYMVPGNEIEAMGERIRADHYRMPSLT
jgi:CPA2 family monovalent cation:H+ antiporter-2